jgi:Di-sulfide bridge nucleocytoplasmic transport domain
MAVCTKEYLQNRCAPGTRVPAMEKACLAWEKCMNRDPSVVGRARVSAETFAEIINSFIEPISYKTMVTRFTDLLTFPDFLFISCVWIGISIEFCFWIITKSKFVSKGTICCSSATNSSTNASANAKFSYDESLEWE